MAAVPDPVWGPVTLDVDSTICETYGLKKQGAASVTPVGVAITRSWRRLPAAKVVGVRLRGGNPIPSGRSWLSHPGVQPCAPGGATGPMVMRADSGFYSSKVTQAVQSGGELLGHGQDSKALHKVIPPSRRRTGTPIPYWIDDGADVAETTYRPFSQSTEVRLIVRRVKPTPAAAGVVFTYDYHAFITDREGETTYLEADHRRHAVVEDVIRDLKYGVGVNHLRPGAFAPMPSG